MNYFYKNLYYRWFLRNHRNDAQIVKQETQFWKANAIQWLTILFTNSRSKMAAANIEKLRKEVNTLDGYLTNRDHNGVETKVPLPILTPEEEIRMKKGKRMHLFLIILLSMIDTFLFSLIAVYFIPPESGYGSKLIFGSIAALSIILCWEGGFSGVLTFLKDRKLFGNGTINETISYLKLILGILLLGIAIGLSISIGVVRMHTLELVDPSLLDSTVKETSNNLKEAGHWASIASMIFAFLTGILLGFSRIMTDTFGVRGRTFRKYQRGSNRISKLRKKLENFNTTIRNDIKDHIERNWKMILYIRTTLRRDFDEEDKSLVIQFKEIRTGKNIVYDENLYNQFQDIQCMDERLFKYGIVNSDAYVTGTEKLDTMLYDFKNILDGLDTRHSISSKYTDNSSFKLLKSNTLLFFLLLSLFFSGCKQEVPKPACITIFIDKSTSLPEETKLFYLDFVFKVLLYLKPGDQVRILPIDRNTESGSLELVNLTIPTADKFSSPFDPPAQKEELLKLRYKKFYRSVIDSVKAGIDKLNKRDIQLENGTDIFGALRLAQGYFDTTKTNILIICSDMLNYSKELKMENVKLNRKFISNALNNLNTNFDKTDYYDLFCVTGPNVGLGATSFLGAKDFWISYFKKVNIKNVVYLSGETSIVEEKLKITQQIKTSKNVDFFSDFF